MNAPEMKRVTTFSWDVQHVIYFHFPFVRSLIRGAAKFFSVIQFGPEREPRVVFLMLESITIVWLHLFCAITRDRTLFIGIRATWQRQTGYWGCRVPAPGVVGSPPLTLAHFWPLGTFMDLKKLERVFDTCVSVRIGCENL